MSSLQDWITEAEFVLDNMNILKMDKKFILEQVKLTHQKIYNQSDEVLIELVRKEYPFWKISCLDSKRFLEVLDQRVKYLEILKFKHNY